MAPQCIPRYCDTLAVMGSKWVYAPGYDEYRPRVATQGLNPVAVDSTKIKISLQKALLLNHIDSFHAVRLVHIDTSWFYQVQNAFNKETVYLSLNNGRLLKNGDWLYAQYIARLFLEGEPRREIEMLCQLLIT